MYEAAVIALFLAMAVFVLCAAVAVVGIGAWWFAKAVRETVTARAHAAQADADARTLHLAEAALDEVEERKSFTPPFDNPSDAELREYVRAQRNGHARTVNDEGDVTTEGNEGIPEQPPIRPGGMYRDQAGYDG